ncbi:MAG TPA: acyltransferase [Acidimicrobiales bacterium]|nr:acyltransferase [Acidimicrobiales bacterium]
MTTTDRRPDIDNLRSLATLLLLVFHTAKVYDYSPFYHVKNDASFQGFDVFTGFLHQWHMPLFFALAGWSMAAAIRRKTAGEIRGERIRRLLIPFAAFFATACLWIGWMEARHAQDRTVGDNGSPLRLLGVAVTWSHLWFLVYLFTFSMLYLRLFARLHARDDDPVVGRASLVRFVGLMIAIQVLLRWAWPGQQTLVWDWANFGYYSAFFIGGFYVGRFPSVDRLVDEHRVVMTRLGVAASAAMVPFWLRLVVVEDVTDWAPYVVYEVLSALAGVGLVIGLAGWARRHFAGDGRLHAWARDRAFGLYLLHQACVVAAAAFVIGTTWPIAVKFSTTLFAATALTIGLNEALRHVEVLAPAFGRDRRVTASTGKSVGVG